MVKNKEAVEQNRKEKNIEEKPLLQYRTIQLFLVNVGMYLITSLLGGSFLITNGYVLVIFGVSHYSFYPLLWYQFITSMFTHSSIAHILSNMIFLLIFGLRGEELGLRNEIVKAYLLSGLAGNIVSAIILPANTVSVGASGAVFGLMAYVIVYLEQKHLISKKTAIFVIILFLVMSGGTAGSSVQVNVVAHLVGALTGYVLAKYEIKNKKKKLKGEPKIEKTN